MNHTVEAIGIIEITAAIGVIVAGIFKACKVNRQQKKELIPLLLKLMKKLDELNLKEKI